MPSLQQKKRAYFKKYNMEQGNNIMMRNDCIINYLYYEQNFNKMKANFRGLSFANVDKIKRKTQAPYHTNPDKR